MNRTQETRRMRRRIESELQIACVTWFSLQYPKIARLLLHPANGGKRGKSEGGIFKAMGVRAGVPDLILLYGSSGYHSLGIELKTDKGRQGPNQKEYMELMQENHSKYVVVRSIGEFMMEIRKYMEGN